MRPSAGATVMPTLALIWTSRVRITNGEANASLSRRVSSAASSGRLIADLQDQELVALEPRQQLAAGQPRLQAHRHLAQQLGAELLAERVVDALEAVEVEMEQRQHLVLLPGTGQLVLEAASGNAPRSAAR